MKVSIIAAVAANGVIGDDGRVPWNYPEDLSHFRQTTVGHPVIMGRRTFETIYQQLGEPLPQRRNIVLTHRPESLPEAAVPATSQSAALRAAAEASTTTAYVIGGGSVYEQFLPRSDELVLTELHASFEGDTVFPAVEWDEWREIDRDCREEFDIVTYARNDPDSSPPE